MKKLSLVLLVLAAMVLLAGCGGIKDGSYEGKSSEDSRGAYSIVKIEVKDGKIASAEFLQYNADGTLKDEKYGEGSGDDNYQKAQNALKASEEYAKKLVEVQSVDKVDAVSGATSSLGQFQEAAKDALSKAK